MNKNPLRSNACLHSTPMDVKQIADREYSGEAFLYLQRPMLCMHLAWSHPRFARAKIDHAKQRA
jgi:hypothetical protein